MKRGRATEMVLIRHAPSRSDGRLCGRADVDADCSDALRFAALAARLGRPARIAVSPARRCRQTLATLWPGAGAAIEDDRLWEQDFGEWDGRAWADLPDLGPLSSADLADHAPPGGESFAGLCRRAGPALAELAAGGDVTVIAHAGIVRAGLALALGSPPAALAFEVAPLSVTRLRLSDGGWSVGAVNWVPA